MLPEVHANPDGAQGQPPGEPEPSTPSTSPASPAADTRETPSAMGVTEARRETSLPAAPPPTPPQGRLATSVQQMSPGGRWVLGLGLAFLSSFALAIGEFFPSFIFGAGPAGINSVVAALTFVVTLMLALAAGIVLSSWRAVVALAFAAAAGGLVAAWVLIQVVPDGSAEGLTGMNAVLVVFAFFAILNLVPNILFLLAGAGIGKLQGIALGQPHARSARDASVTRWIAALAPVIGAAILARIVPGMFSMEATQGDVATNFSGIFYAVVLAATCLLAGWLLHSWWGFVAAPLVYVGIVVFSSQMFGAGGGWTGGLALYVVLPAVVMSAIGTAIGMYTAGHGGQRPHYGELAT